jgi:arylsulfatase A-like enzyme
VSAARRGLLFVWVAFLTAGIALPGRADAQTTEPPNILIFVTDDQRATDTLWVMPKTRYWFRQNGTQYPNAFATTPLCCPSRATIFTGRYAHNTGVRTQRWRPLDMTTMFPRLLQEAGYQSGLSGKFMNGWRFTTPPPYFDHWALCGRCASNDLSTFNVDGVIQDVVGHSTNLFGKYAVRFLRGFETDDARPWLLYLAPTSPHWPWTPQRKYASVPLPTWRGNPAVFERDRSDKPAFVRDFNFTLEGGRVVRDGQLRELMSVDDVVGRVFTVLDRMGETANTLAIFTSDNGFTWAEHGLGGDGGTAGQKRVPYTPSIQVPFFLRWPGHVPPGVRDRRLTGNVDIAPTVLAATGISADPAKPPLDGASLLSPDARLRLLLEYWRGSGRFPTWASLRTSAYQYTEYYADDGVTRTFREYYDLMRDPWQLQNLLRDGISTNNPSVAPLSRQLAHDRACAGREGPEPCP